MAVFDVSRTAPVPGHPSPLEPRLARILDDEAGAEHLAARVIAVLHDARTDRNGEGPQAAPPAVPSFASVDRRPDEASAETGSYLVAITHNGRASTVQARAEGARARVADRDGLPLDQLAATVAAITPPVQSMSDLAIALDPRSLPADHDAGGDCPECSGDGFPECREDDDGTVWPTKTCAACEGTGKAQTEDAVELDPQAAAILADWQSAPTFAPFVHFMPR